MSIKYSQQVLNILTNFSIFEETQGELITGTAKLKQINWSNIFGMLPGFNDTGVSVQSNSHPNNS